MTYCRDARLVRPQSLPTSSTPVGCAGKKFHNHVLFITFNSISILFQALARQNRDFCLRLLVALFCISKQYSIIWKYQAEFISLRQP